MTRTIAVLGAGGHTGRLVVAALERRGANVRALTRREADASRRESVRAAIRGADALVNLAGPFLRTGLAPIEAAIDEGIPYVDTTGEQAFMALARERLDARARERGVPIVNALAFEYAFGDLAARLHFPEGGGTLHVLYWPRATKPSAGTKKSMIRVFAASTLSYERGKLERVAFGKFARTFETDDGPRLGLSFAGGEILSVPRHTPFATVRTYYRTPPRSAAWLRRLAPVARLALRGPILRLGDRLIDRRHQAPTNEHGRGEIHLVAEPSGRRVVVRTPDGYAATAEIVAEGALRLAPARGGVLAPAEAFDPATMLDAMRRAMPGFDVAEFPSRSPG